MPETDRPPRPEQPTHPKLAAGLLMGGIVVLIVALSLMSL